MSILISTEEIFMLVSGAAVTIIMYVVMKAIGDCEK
jgi:hypothetical protein